jgi:hypothetical protein
MKFDELKAFAVLFLQSYQKLWIENAALRAMISHVQMPDGTKGIPEWESRLARYLSNEDALRIAQERFAPIFSLIESSQNESELLDIWQRFPPSSGTVH